jgi:TolB-like protein
VLPFGRFSSDPEQESLVADTTDDLTTDLSGMAGSFVMTGLGHFRLCRPVSGAADQPQ